MSHCPLLTVVVGLQGAHTGSGRHSWYLLRAPCPGSGSAHSTGTSYLLSAQVPWLVQECVTCNRQRLSFAFVYVHACVGAPVCVVLSLCAVFRMSPTLILSVHSICVHAICIYMYLSVTGWVCRLNVLRTCLYMCTIIGNAHYVSKMSVIIYTIGFRIQRLEMPDKNL